MQSRTFVRNTADSVGGVEVCLYHWEYCSVLHRIIDTFYGSYGFEVKEDFLLRSIQGYSSPVFRFPVGSLTFCLFLTQNIDSFYINVNYSSSLLLPWSPVQYYIRPCGVLVPVSTLHSTNL